jgi:glycosyltransferase involved in cell wall biosynthesis
MPLRVLMVGGPKADFVGGNRVQRDETMRALRDLGVDVVPGTPEDARGGRFDVVHVFARDVKRMRACRTYGIPVALSTIYSVEGQWPPAATMGEQMRRRLRRCRGAWRALRETWCGRGTDYCTGQMRGRHETRVRFELADLLLPNSESEARMIREQLGVTTPCHVVPNGVDPARFTEGKQAAAAPREYVTCVARIEPQKNQLGVIEALRNTHHRVRIVGPSGHQTHHQYHERCRARATSNIEFTGPLAGDDLVQVYRTTRVHVLASDSETTGLVSLEAVLCGANIVTTFRGYARDYFGEMAWYCHANSPRSIREAVDAAYATPYRSELRDRILREFTWQHTAEATLAGYEKLLAWRGVEPALGLAAAGSSVADNDDSTGSTDGKCGRESRIATVD